jgi:hypothetical protein
MSRLDHANMSREPGPECYCGAELKQVPLPPDLKAVSGQEFIWLHAETGDTRCYPDEEGGATATPLTEMVAP